MPQLLQLALLVLCPQQSGSHQEEDRGHQVQNQEACCPHPAVDKHGVRSSMGFYNRMVCIYTRGSGGILLMEKILQHPKFYPYI